MRLQDYVEEIKLRLTGGVLKLELTDKQLENVVNMSLREMQRYINEKKLMTIPFAKCIDLKESGVRLVTKVYRTSSAGSPEVDGSYTDDPLAMQWSVYTSGYGLYNLNDWLMNYLSYNTLEQIHSSRSTDLAFKHDRHDNKLYINVTDMPNMITIEYIPVFKDVEELVSEYWQDTLLSLSIANTKIILGRIRTKFKQTNAVWTVDGEAILAEGIKERDELIAELKVNSQVTYVHD